MDHGATATSDGHPPAADGRQLQGPTGQPDLSPVRIADQPHLDRPRTDIANQLANVIDPSTSCRPDGG